MDSTLDDEKGIRFNVLNGARIMDEYFDKDNNQENSFLVNPSELHYLQKWSVKIGSRRLICPATPSSNPRSCKDAENGRQMLLSVESFLLKRFKLGLG